MRVHQLAKQLKITSEELVDKLHSLKIEVKGHMSVLDDDTAFLVKEELKPKKAKRGIKKTREGLKPSPTKTRGAKTKAGKGLEPPITKAPAAKAKVGEVLKPQKNIVGEGLKPSPTKTSKVIEKPKPEEKKVENKKQE